MPTDSITLGLDIPAPAQRVRAVLSDPAALARMAPSSIRAELRPPDALLLFADAGAWRVRMDPVGARLVYGVRSETGASQLSAEVEVSVSERGAGTRLEATASVTHEGDPGDIQALIDSTAGRLAIRSLSGAVTAEATAPPGTTVRHSVLRNALRGWLGTR